MDPSEIDRIYAACTRFLTHHYPRPPRLVLEQLAAQAEPYAKPDRYGEGELIEAFEAEIAALLGKEAAVFMLSGTMCQQIALRLWAEQKGTFNVAYHPLSHLEIHEDKAYQALHGLHAALVGSPHRLLTLADLKKLRGPLAALLLELPQRELGGLLPAWEDLLEQVEWARSQGIALHLDGARLWESGPFYDRPYAEIAALFDSVYVSFYKGLGGLSGSVLAGPADFIGQARLWQHRHGGLLFQQYPYVLSARQGLQRHLDQMPAYHRKAAALAEALAALSPRLEIVPNPPCTNMMHLYLRGSAESLVQAALEISSETGVWLFRALFPTPLPGTVKFELTVGEATLDLTEAEILGLFEALFEKAGSDWNTE